MKEKIITELAKMNAARCGLEPMLQHTMEELAELIVALSKYIRYADYSEDGGTQLVAVIAEEIADCRCMLEQVAYLLEISENTITEIMHRKKRMVGLKLTVMQRINRIHNHQQQEVLIARYVEGMPWQRIAGEMHYAESYIYKLHGRALVSYAELKEDSK